MISVRNLIMRQMARTGLENVFKVKQFNCVLVRGRRARFDLIAGVGQAHDVTSLRNKLRRSESLPCK